MRTLFPMRYFPTTRHDEPTNPFHFERFAMCNALNCSRAGRSPVAAFAPRHLHDFAARRLR